MKTNKLPVPNLLSDRDLADLFNECNVEIAGLENAIRVLRESIGSIHELRYKASSEINARVKRRMS